MTTPADNNTETPRNTPAADAEGHTLRLLSDATVKHDVTPITDNDADENDAEGHNYRYTSDATVKHDVTPITDDDADDADNGDAEGHGLSWSDATIKHDVTPITDDADDAEGHVYPYRPPTKGPSDPGLRAH